MSTQSTHSTVKQLAKLISIELLKSTTQLPNNKPLDQVASDTEFLTKVAQCAVSIVKASSYKAPVIKVVNDATPIKVNDSTLSEDLQKTITISATEVLAKIRNLLLEMGVPTHLSGYQYIFRALYLCYTGNASLSCLTKNLYPKIATEYSVSPYAVERAIRNALLLTSKVASPTFKHSFNKVPSNKVFLNCLLDKMLIDTINNHF